MAYKSGSYKIKMIEFVMTITPLNIDFILTYSVMSDNSSQHNEEFDKSPEFAEIHTEDSSNFIPTNQSTPTKRFNVFIHDNVNGLIYDSIHKFVISQPTPSTITVIGRLSSDDTITELTPQEQITAQSLGFTLPPTITTKTKSPKKSPPTEESNTLWDLAKNFCKICDIFSLCDDNRREMISMLERCPEVNLHKICDIYGIYTLQTATKSEIIDSILKEDISPSNVIDLINISRKYKFIRVCHAKKIKQACGCTYTKDSFSYEYRSVYCRKYQNHSVFMNTIPSDYTLNEKNGRFSSDASRLCDICQSKHKLQGFIVAF